MRPQGGGGVSCQETRAQPTAVVSTAAARVCVVCSGRAGGGLRAHLVLVLLALLELTLQLDLPGGGRVQEKSQIEPEECANVQRDGILFVFTSSGNDSWSIRAALPCERYANPDSFTSIPGSV